MKKRKLNLQKVTRINKQLILLLICKCLFVTFAYAQQIPFVLEENLGDEQMYDLDIIQEDFSLLNDFDLGEQEPTIQAEILACSGSTNTEVGGFTLCASADSPYTMVELDRNDWFNGSTAPANAMPSESYLINFPLIQDSYPCLTNADVEDVIFTITINSWDLDFPPGLECCQDYVNGIFANLYKECDYDEFCDVFGDGLINNTNPGTGDCSPAGEHLEYNSGSNDFDLGLPFVSTVSCVEDEIDLDQMLSVDIIPNIVFETALAGGCSGCPQNAISAGYISIDFDITYEFVFCSSDIPDGCVPISFDPIDSVCDTDGFISLPTMSNEGIMGTWDVGTFWDISAEGGNTATATFMPNPGGCITTPAILEVEVERCCAADGGEIEPAAAQSICSAGGNYQTLDLNNDINGLSLDNASLTNLYQFFLVDPNGVIIDNSDDLINIDFPPNNTNSPIDYCIYGLSYKLTPGLGTIINGTTTLLVGDGDVLEDGDGNELEAAPNADGACMDLSDNCVTFTVEAPAVAPTANNINTCAGGDTEIIPTGNGSTFNFYADASLSTLLTSGASYDPNPSAGSSVDVWITEGTSACESAAVMVTVSIVDGADAGDSNSIGLCSDAASSVDLFASLLGMPDAGGAWTDNDASGADISDPTSVDFSAINADVYTFTYTIAASGACAEESAVLTINLANPFDAGTDNSIAVCSASSSSTNLFTSLGGSPDAGGTWSDDNTSGVNLSDPTNVDFVGIASGDYDFTYSSTTSGLCLNSVSTITVSVSGGVNAGTNGAISICDGGNGIINLEAALGNPNPNGTWSDDDNTGVDLSDPTMVDCVGIPVGMYDYTYTVAGGNCPDGMASVTVSIGAAPNAGTSNSVMLCNEGSTADLLAIIGNPDAGGTWSDNDASAVNLSDPTAVDFTGITANTYNFTYTIAATSSCPEVSATATINLSAAGNAGMDGSATFCIGSSSAIDLFATLEGTPDLGGTWSDTNTSGADISNPTSVDFTSIAPNDYDFTYTIAGTNGCPDVNAVVSISVIQQSNPGTDNSLTICEGDNTSYDFYAILGASESINSGWVGNNSSSVDLTDAFNVNLSSLGAGSYDFTYSILGTSECPGGMATLSVTVEAAPNTGTTNPPLMLCNDSDSAIDLFSLLENENTGGIWTETSPTPSGGTAFDAANATFNPNGQTAATYIFNYAIAGNAPCTSANTDVSIIVNNIPNVDLGTDINQCIGDGSITLDAGNAGATYTWTVAPNDGNNGATTQSITIADAALPTTTYQVEVNQNGCIASDDIEVTINPLPTLAEDAKECSADLSSYTVTVSTDGDNIVSSDGTVMDNTDGTFTISMIPTGMNITITASNSTTNCSEDFTIDAPDCACAMVNPPTGDDVAICADETIPALTASADAGLQINWYDAATGGTLLAADSDSFTPTMAGTFFAEALNPASNCTSVLTPIELTINPLPTLAEGTKDCSADLSSYTVTVSTGGDNIVSSDGTVMDNTDGTFTISMIPTGMNITITASNSTTNCSEDFTVDAPDCACATVNPPTGDDVAICADETIPALTASADAGLQINWYDAATGGTLLAADSDSFTPTMAGTFFAEALDPASNCTSVLTPIELTINPLPTLAEGTKDCSADLSSYTVTVSTDGDNIVSSDGTVIDNTDGTFTISMIPTGMNITITVSNSTTNCSEDFTVEAPDCACATVNPPTGDDVAICADETIPALTASVDAGLQINWYDAATGGTLLAADSDSFTPTMAGTYFAEALDPASNCTSVLTPIELTINPLPTLAEGTKDCSADLSSYTVTVSTDGDNIVSSDGTVMDNTDGTFTISMIPTGMNITVTASNSTTNCSEDFTVDAPDCACAMVNPPTGDDVAICVDETIPELTASADAGLQINWYDAATGGTLLAADSDSFTPTMAGTYFAEALDPASNCTSVLTPIELTINPLPTLAEGTKDCSADLSSYTVTVSTDGDNIVSSDGTVIDNTDGTFTISMIPTGMNITITVSNSTTNCSEDFTVDAPDCACPSFSQPTITTICNNNGTPDNSADDVFSYSIEMASIGLGSTYSIMGDDSQSNLNYEEESGLFGAFPIADGSIMITIIDDTNSNCSLLDIEIEAPATCSECVETASAGMGIELNCANTSGSLSATASSAGQFDWIGPNGFVVNDEANPTVSEAGTYILTVSFDNGCTAIDEVEVILDPSTPNADAGLEQSINCTTTEVQLGGNNTSTGTQYTYSWTGPNGFISSDINPMVDEAGMYTLVVSDTANNCTSEPSEVVILDESNTPIAIITADPITMIDCVISEIQLTADQNNSASTTYNWEFSDTSQEGEMITVTQSGTYTLLVVDTLTGCSETDQIDVESNVDYPIIDFGSIDQIDCINPSIVLDASASQSGASISYQWTELDGTPLGTGTSLMLENGGSYIFEASDSANGCVNADTVVVVENINLPNVEAGENQLLDCNDMTTQLLGSATTPNTTIEWSPAANIVSGINESTPTVNTSDWYYITVNNPANGCTAIDSVFVDSPPLPETAAISLDQPDCTGSSTGTILVGNVNGGTAPYLYNINDSDFGQNPSFGNLTPATYTIGVEDLNGCTWDTTLVIIENFDITLDLGPDQQVALGDSILLNPSLNILENSLDTIFWNEAEALSCTDCLTPWLTPSTSGTYVLEVMDENGCTAMDEITIIVRSFEKVFIPSVFSPNDDGINDVFSIFAGNEVQQINTFQIFDRWGNNVYKMDDFDPRQGIGWDGRFKGKIMKPAVFIYYAEIEFLNGTTQVINGDVSLIR